MSQIQPVQIPETERHTLSSRAGREYEILLARPSGTPPPGGFPAIYLLEANATFGTFVDAIRMRSARPEVTGVVPTVVVGIAYPGALVSDRSRRTFDFTAGPAAGESHRPGAIGHPPGGTGGADALLDFLRHEVRPFVADRIAVDPERETLFGHSLAGYFVLRTLLTAPGAFRGYVAASPSIWWDEAGLLAAVREMGAGEGERSALARRVMVTVGEYEQKLAPWEEALPQAPTTAARRGTRTMVESARRLAERLREEGGGGVEVAFEEFAGEDHASSVLRTIGRCLRFVLAP